MYIIHQMKALVASLFATPLFPAALAFLILVINVLFNLPVSNFLFLLIGAYVLLIILSEPLRIRIIHRFSRFLSPKSTILLFSFFLVYLFLVRFPLGDWNKIILEDDYTPGYIASIKGFESLREGGIFGWDGKIMGGYPHPAEAPMNKSMFLAPFLLFLPAPVSYHLMIFVAFMLFPFLALFYARTLFNDRITESITFTFAAILLLSFFRNFLTFGMVDALLGLDFLVFNLILFEKIKNGSRISSFLLTLSIPLTMYAHIGFFFISLFFIAIELITNWSRPLFFRTFAILTFAFFMTLHEVFYMLVYRSYFPTGPEFYDPKALTLSIQLSDNIRFLKQLFNPLQIFTLRYNLENLIVAFIPLLIYVYSKGSPRAKRIALYLLLIPIIRGFQLPTTMVITFRIVFVVALLLPVLMADLIRQELRNNRIHNLLFIPFLFLPTLGTHTWFAMRHIESVDKEFPALSQAFRSFDGHQILLETVSHLNTMAGFGDERSERPTQGLTHWDNLLSYSIPEKRFLANTTETYHFYKYRDLYINAGAWKGRPIETWSTSEFNAFLKKWGVHYITVWSERSIAYFSRFQEYYEPVTQIGRWHIFRFRNEDLRSIEIANGEGTYQDIGRFAKTIVLTHAVQGDTATLRESYFPNWTVLHQGQKIPLINRGNQLAFVVPKSGTVEISMRFPKYHPFSIVAFISCLLSFLAFVKPGFLERNDFFRPRQFIS